MYFWEHFTYTAGAFTGALTGSFFMHCFDTIATRKFIKANSLGFQGTTKNIIHSFKPVAIGVVPMRAASFGVYSISQELFLSNLGFAYWPGKVLSAVMSGISLSVLTLPAEIIKTRKQLNATSTKLKIDEIRKCIVPLGLRVVPTVTCMLAGTEFLQPMMPSANPFFSMTLASLMAATASQIIGTPSDNIRIHRIHHEDYKTSLMKLARHLKPGNLYTGFWLRSFSLGIQASFTLSMAIYMSNTSSYTHPKQDLLTTYQHSVQQKKELQFSGMNQAKMASQTIKDPKVQDFEHNKNGESEKTKKLAKGK